MKHFFTLIFSIFLLSNLYSQDKVMLETYWKNGLNFESSDKSFSVKLGGRIMYDVMLINQDDSLNTNFEAENGTEFRRARLYTSGTVYKTIKYKFQIDFAGNAVVIKDAYLRFTKIPYVGNITLGNFKEPRGFEMLTSSNFITMMERSLTNQFDNDRNLGVMINNSFLNKNLSVFAGFFFPSGNNAKYSGNKYNLVFRLSGTPYYKVDNDYRIIHIGGGVTYENHDNQLMSYSSRPEAHLAPKYLNVKVDEADNLVEYNGELIVILNKFSFQSEYTHSTVNTGEYSTLQEDKYAFYSFFGTVSWFLTGEHKNYSKSKSAFERVIPKKNFGSKGGFGAIEFALRYSDLNLNYKDLNGGKMDNITFGVNWYLNPVTRIDFNYVNSNIKDQGVANIYQMRFQINF